jgi:glutamate-1-semialdehyde aminotransferase
MTSDTAKLRRFNEVCLRNGVLKGGSKIYVSIVHDEADVERTLAVFKDALQAVARL